MTRLKKMLASCLLCGFILPLTACSQAAPTSLTVTATPTAIQMAATATATATPAAQGKISMGYYTGSQASFAAVKSFSSYINLVSADVYAVTADGSISGHDDLGVAAYGRAHGLSTYACISNYNSSPLVNDFDAALAKAAIVTHKEQLIPALVKLAQDGNYDGINIDFEGISSGAEIETDRANFSVFIHELAGQLHGQGLKLIISVPAKTEDNTDDSWSYPFDLAALGQDADYLQVMTYDEHGPWSEAGPVSGADYTASVVDPAKLLIGLPAYGYNWSEDGSARDFSWTAVPSLLAKPGVTTHWDETAQSPWASYSEGGQTHTAWYEDVKSIQAKTALVSQYQLGGISVWALGKEDENFWQAATAFQSGH
jgi:spore germination protein YaaH